MKIHEYQAKEILKQHGVPVPKGEVAGTPEDAERIARDLGGPVVVKAQIHAGGRGKGGGVKLAGNAADARRAAGEIIGMDLVTHQTGPQGQRVKQVLVEEATDIDRELYLGITLDRAQSKLVVMASRAGGMDIEAVAAEMPEKILKETVDPGAGLQAFQARRLAFGLGLEGDLIRPGVQLITGLYSAYAATDCSLAEINPMVVTGGGELLALDAKMNFDDNARFRHRDILGLRDMDEEAPLEVEASKYDLNYIKLDGEVGCMVNGAGLAMATMDIVKLAGSSPANFLDVGGRHECGKGAERLPHPDVGCRCKGRADQYLRGHRPVRPGGGGRRAGPGGPHRNRPDRGPPAGHQRRGGRADPGGIGPGVPRGPGAEGGRGSGREGRP